MPAEKTMYEMRQYLYSKQLHDLLDQGMTPKNAVNMLDSKFDKDMNLSKSELSEQVSKSEKSISEQNAIRIQSYIEKFVKPEIIKIDDIEENMNNDEVISM